MLFLRLSIYFLRISFCHILKLELLYYSVIILIKLSVLHSKLFLSLSTVPYQPLHRNFRNRFGMFVSLHNFNVYLLWHDVLDKDIHMECAQFHKDINKDMCLVKNIYLIINTKKFH